MRAAPEHSWTQPTTCCLRLRSSRLASLFVGHWTTMAGPPAFSTTSRVTRSKSDGVFAPWELTVQRDVVIVGAGHNGLVAAFYLARAGLRVEMAEAQAEVGGACKTEELIPGYRFSTCANYLFWARSRVVEDMRLFERGVHVGGGDLFSRRDSDAWSSTVKHGRRCLRATFAAVWGP
jgi:hypothetical protein